MIKWHIWLTLNHAITAHHGVYQRLAAGHCTISPSRDPLRVLDRINTCGSALYASDTTKETTEIRISADTDVVASSANANPAPLAVADLGH